DLEVGDLALEVVASERIGGNIRKSLDIPYEPYLVFCKFEMDRYNSHLFEFMTVCSNAIAEARHSHSFLPKALEIQIRGCYGRLSGKAGRCSVSFRVFIHHGVPVPCAPCQSRPATAT